MGIQKNEKIIADFIQKIEKRKLPFNDFSITKATAPTNEYAYVVYAASTSMFLYRSIC